MPPDTVDFGAIPLGGNYFGQIVYFENATGSPIEINSPYISGQPGRPFAWFSNLIGRFTIGDGFSLRYSGRFQPSWEGAFEDDLCVPVAGFPHPCVHLRAASRRCARKWTQVGSISGPGASRRQGAPVLHF